jgi:hypothetical protein
MEAGAFVAEVSALLADVQAVLLAQVCRRRHVVIRTMAAAHASDIPSHSFAPRPLCTQAQNC